MKEKLSVTKNDRPLYAGVGGGGGEGGGRGVAAVMMQSRATERKSGCECEGGVSLRAEPAHPAEARGVSG